MKSQIFTHEDQMAFAELSGDYNPLHMDALAARRLMYGGALVHGVHSLLWALDSWLENRTDPLHLRSIRCAFPKPLRVGEKAHLSLVSEGKQHVGLDVTDENVIVTRIEFEWDPIGQPALDDIYTGFPEKVQPKDLSPDDIETRSGTLELQLDRKAAAKLFPHLTGMFSSSQLAVLLSTTRLVGMECPGLHSAFRELNLVASQHSTDGVLAYKVTRLDRRFSSVAMNVMAPGMAGTIKAFIRPVPPKQLGYTEMQQLVRDGEFSGQRALIIGGSRGLGEVTAKVLTAGAADVKLTYHQGKMDGDRVIQEIVSSGGIAECFPLDVLRPQLDSLFASLGGWKPTHLYYFPTPFIFSGSKDFFSQRLFNRFCDYYITGFLNVLNLLKSTGPSKVFYPSSVAVDEAPPGLSEYAAAKAAGEILCRSFESGYSPFTIYKPRLPRMATDQTVSVLPIDNQEPAAIMLEHLRVFRDM